VMLFITWVSNEESMLQTKLTRRIISAPRAISRRSGMNAALRARRFRIYFSRSFDILSAPLK
jgi:hypothetical protein